jgi:hypothetical protein
VKHRRVLKISVILRFARGNSGLSGPGAAVCASVSLLLVSLVATSLTGCGSSDPPSMTSLREHVTIQFPSTWKKDSDDTIKKESASLPAGKIKLYQAYRGNQDELITVMATDLDKIYDSKLEKQLATEITDIEVHDLGSIEHDNDAETVSDAKVVDFCGTKGTSKVVYDKKDHTTYTMMAVKVVGMPTVIAWSYNEKADAETLRALQSLCVTQP